MEGKALPSLSGADGTRHRGNAAASSLFKGDTWLIGPYQDLVIDLDFGAA